MKRKQRLGWCCDKPRKSTDCQGHQNLEETMNNRSAEPLEGAGPCRHPASDSGPQNKERINGCRFKPLGLRVVCYRKLVQSLSYLNKGVVTRTVNDQTLGNRTEVLNNQEAASQWQGLRTALSLDPGASQHRSPLLPPSDHFQEVLRADGQALFQALGINQWREGTRTPACVKPGSWWEEAGVHGKQVIGK